MYCTYSAPTIYMGRCGLGDFLGQWQTNTKGHEIERGHPSDIPKSPSGKSHAGLLNFLSMRRMDARLMKATAMAVRFSKSLARRRHRLSHANVRSTTHRRGKTLNPFAVSERFTISTERPGKALAKASRNFGP